MIKKQKIFVIIAAILAVLLIPIYIFVVLPLTKTEEDPSTDNNREIMYTQTERANIKSIEVKNSHGSYKFVYLEEFGDYYIENNIFASYDTQLFSQLIVNCGYTLSLATVENQDAQNLSEYGLDEHSDPAYFILTTKENKSYKVLIGDKTVTGGGYYARMDGENKVYVLNNTLESTVLSPIEAYVTPLIIYPTSSTTYIDIETFELYRGAYMPSDFTVGTEDEGEGSENTEATENQGNPIIKFHYIETQELGVTSNVIFKTDYPVDSSYSISDSATNVLAQFISYEGEKTVLLSPSTEDLTEYGVLADAEYTLYFINHRIGNDSNGKITKLPVKNRVAYSKEYTDEKTGEKYRYAHSIFFNSEANIYSNLIIKVPSYEYEFLSYDINTWVDSAIFSKTISLVDSIKVQSKDNSIFFDLQGTSENLSVTEENGHKPDINNFKRFYQTLLMMYKGGFVNLSEDEINALIQDESNITSTFTVKMNSGQEYIYRFYSLGQQTYYSINGEGQSFYIETKYVTKALNDAIRITRDEIVNISNAY